MSEGQWLSLSDVAEMLGVHPSTVRAWSDQGVLPVHRTSGGHRRYQRSEIELWIAAQRGQPSDEAFLVVQNAMRSARFQINEGAFDRQPWYQKLDDEARDQYRVSGRGLMQGLVNAMSAGPAQMEAGAEALGYEYASRGRRYGLSSVEAVTAFLFFRNLLIESMLSVYESAAVQSPHAWSDMFRKINEFTNIILITLLETYEAYQRVRP
jgi:excisionase family DNA binding protein